MLSNIELLEKWNNLKFHNGSYLRIDSDHPLEWYIGFEGINEKSLLFVTPFEPKAIQSSKSILISTGTRTDSNWAITFRLIRVNYEEVFIHLCCDLIESSRSYRNNLSGLQYVLTRYATWTKLMELQQDGLLSESRRKGLIGELLFLHERISCGLPSLTAVEGWVGPEGADQDFSYAQGWHEVKAVVSDATSVSISSVEQLDAPIPGELVVHFIDKVSPQDGNAFSLPDAIANIKRLVEGDAVSAMLFEEKLLRYGYIDLVEYYKHRYRLTATKKYCLNQDFPRIRRETLPVEIPQVRYGISIPSLEPWRV